MLTNGTKPGSLLSLMEPENDRDPGALADLQRNSGVLSGGLGFWETWVWVSGSRNHLFSVWLLSERGRQVTFHSKMSASKRAALPLCDNVSPTKVNKARCVSVTKGGPGGRAADGCDSCATTQYPE